MAAIACAALAALLFFGLRRPPGPSPPVADCALCANLAPSHGDSSPRDLVISGIFGAEERVDRFVRTLRASGSEAAIVLITNRSVEPSIASDYRKCGAEFFVMNTSRATDHFYPHSLRYIGYRQFLSATDRVFDRIFHTDSFDVFFQSDPFTRSIRRDRLYFVLERPTIGDSEWNTGWLIRAYNESISKALANFTVSCSGTVLGGAAQFRMYLDTLLGHEPFWRNGRHTLDQAYHNFLLHTGEFERAGARPELLGCDSQILTMHYCWRGTKDTKDTEDGMVVSPNGSLIPAVVHQYNLFRGASKVLAKICP
jgi:hypothetical protein